MAWRDKLNELKDHDKVQQAKDAAVESLAHVDLDALKDAALESSGVTNGKGDVKRWRVAKASAMPSGTLAKVAKSVGKEAVRQQVAGRRSASQADAAQQEVVDEQQSQPARRELDMGTNVAGAWDDPRLGLTVADFARWPDVGGLSKLDRDKTVPLLQAAIDNGDLDLPVYLIGKCSTYPTPHGHPSFAGAIEDWVTFALWAQPGAPWPNITTITSKGLMGRRVESRRLPEFNHVEVEVFEQSNGGYVDLQMSMNGMPTARIGFYWSPSSYQRAHEQVQAVMNAGMTCRQGLLPNGERPA